MREVEEQRRVLAREGGCQRADPVEKLHRRRKRTRNKLRGNSIKKGGCQSGLSWLPHPVVCAKFQKRPVPSLTCGGEIKMIDWSLRSGRGLRQNEPSSISLLTHSHTSKYCNINNTHAHKHTYRTASSPPFSICQEDPAGGKVEGGVVVVGGRDALSVLLPTRHSNDIPSDQPFWYVSTLHPTTKPA